MAVRQQDAAKTCSNSSALRQLDKNSEWAELCASVQDSSPHRLSPLHRQGHTQRRTAAARARLAARRTKRHREIQRRGTGSISPPCPTLHLERHSRGLAREGCGRHRTRDDEGMVGRHWQMRKRHSSAAKGHSILARPLLSFGSTWLCCACFSLTSRLVVSFCPLVLPHPSPPCPQQAACAACRCLRRWPRAVRGLMGLTAGLVRCAPAGRET